MLEKKIVIILEEYFKDNQHKSSIPLAHISSAIKPKCAPNLCKFLITLLESNEKVIVKQDKVYPTWHKVTLTSKQEKMKKEIIARFEDKCYAPPSQRELENQYGKEVLLVVETLIDDGYIIVIEDGAYFKKDVLGELISKILELFNKNGNQVLDITNFKEEFHFLSRKNLIQLLDFSDKIHLTRRVENGRALENSFAIEEYI
jgi:hypothetical protein